MLLERYPMFRRLNERVIESDEGFAVEHVRTFDLAYREGDRQATLPIEYLTGPAKFIVSLGEYMDCWDPPHHKEKISNEYWMRIGERIRQAYESQGVMIKVHPPLPPEEREALRAALKRIDPSYKGPWEG